jgi:uncharacterized membrane protein YcaP (DUF421 family)
METILRVVVIYLFLLAGMRLIGKREFSQLSAHEFVVLLIIPEMVSAALNQNDRSITNALVGVSTILGLVFLTSILSHRFKSVEKLVSDSAAILVHNGHLFEDICNKERITPEEIMAEARKSGVESVEEIKWAVLESDGKIGIVPAQQDSGGAGSSQKEAVA